MTDAQREEHRERITALMKIAKERVILSDPINILSSLNIDFKVLNNGNRYRFSSRGERTPSSYLGNIGGAWRWKDFALGKTTKTRSVIDLVAETLGDSGEGSFKRSLVYCLETLGMYDEIENINGRNISKEEIQRAISFMDKLREESKKKHGDISRPVSRVVANYPVATNESVVEYLASRGITNPPNNLRVIIGEYEKDGKKKKRFGVGVLTLDGGADIHFLKKVGHLKSMRLGSGSDISYFPPERTVEEKNNPVAIFESKMDWAAAVQVMDLSSSHIYISNSTSNATIIAKHILENVDNISYKSSNLYFFNQNDGPAYDFVYTIAKELKIPSVNFIKYDLVGEYGKDVNDILLDGTLDKNRFAKKGVLEIQEASIFMKKYKDKLKSYASLDANTTTSHEKNKEVPKKKVATRGISM